MTRLEAWAARVTREMLEAWWRFPKAEEPERGEAARTVLGREVRAFVDSMPTELPMGAWLDEPEPDSPPMRRDPLP